MGYLSLISYLREGTSLNEIEHISKVPGCHNAYAVVNRLNDRKLESYNALCIMLHKVPILKINEFANKVEPEEVAHNEQSHLDPQCLLSLNYQYDILGQNILSLLSWLNKS